MAYYRGITNVVLLQLHCRNILQLLQYCQGKKRENEKQRKRECACAWTSARGEEVWDVRGSEAAASEEGRAETWSSFGTHRGCRTSSRGSKQTRRRWNTPPQQVRAL